MTLKMGQYQERIVVEHVFADMHLIKPFAALYWKRGNSVFISNVYRAKIPAVDCQCLAVLFGGVTASFIVGIGLNDRCFRKAAFNQVFNPGSRNDVGTFRFTGMKLDRNFIRQDRRNPVKDLDQSLLREVAGEKHHGTLTAAFLIGNVFVPVFPRNRFCLTHMYPSLLKMWSGLASFTYCIIFYNTLPPVTRFLSVFNILQTGT